MIEKIDGVDNETGQRRGMTSRGKLVTVFLIIWTIGLSWLLMDVYSTGLWKKFTSSLSPPSPLCQPKRHIFFLKTHKTASSTVLNVLTRYGENHNLTFALPFEFSFRYPKFFQANMVKGFNSTNRPQYDIMCHHMRFNQSEVEKVMPRDSFYFTILRDPATIAVSSFFFFRSLVENAPNLTAYISNPSAYHKKNDRSRFLFHNLMWYDLGFDPEASLTSAEAGVQAVEKTFNLVLLAEYFDESMVLLRNELCWELDDVVSFKINSRNSSEHLEPEQKQTLRAWKALDWYLYTYFNQTFWKKVEHFGRLRMINEVKKLRERRQQLSELCLERPGMVKAKDVKDESIRPDQPAPDNDIILGWSVKENLPPDDHAHCCQIVRPEWKYKQVLDARQFTKPEFK